MANKQLHYVCDNCGDSFPKWSGRCASCQQWNTLKQLRVSPMQSSNPKSLKQAAWQPKPLGDLVSNTHNAASQRLKSGIEPFDDIMGGGFVPGSVVLLAGEPGIGKSTLLLQIAACLSGKQPVLYVSAEESLQQVATRAQRLQLDNLDNVTLASHTSTNIISQAVQDGSYAAIIVDSVQTIQLDSLQSSAGTASQITQSAQQLSQAAKQTDTTLILVGHVTKEGSIAGPKLLEHLVDVVVQLEGDKFGSLKMLRSIKNRYGATDQVGLFTMSDRGLQPVANPSAALLEQRQATDGSIVMATMEGNRPLLVEIQALVNRTNFGYPKRTASGFDLNRLNVLIAVLNRRTKVDLNNFDVFVNIVGGMRIQEPAADLAICMALASAGKGVVVADDAVVFGEVGLSGEVRQVQSIDARLREAQKLGFKKVIGPPGKYDTSIYKPAASVREALRQNFRHSTKSKPKAPFYE